MNLNYIDYRKTPIFPYLANIWQTPFALVLMLATQLLAFVLGESLKKSPSRKISTS